MKILLKERLDLKYTRKLFSLIPHELTDCLKKVLTLTFDDKPNYAYLRETLAACAIKYLNKDANKPKDTSGLSNLELLNQIEFEWV